jgi:L-ascorbate metabolism protein UlaG (beta-lactamase superfamily)
MKIKGIEFELFTHNAFRISNDTTIYIDPFKLDEPDQADIVLISHEHFDHCSREDIEQVITDDTVLICNANSLSKVNKLPVAELISAAPGDTFDINDVHIHAVPAYNTNKFRSENQPFHPRDDHHCGYIITMEDITIYYAGDTDPIDEMHDITCDIALLPVSGEYVMTAEEAAKAVDLVNPTIAIPMHYGEVAGDRDDAERFKELVKGKAKVEILL